MTRRELLAFDGIGKGTADAVERVVQLKPAPKKPPSKRAQAMGDPRAKLVANLWTTVLGEVHPKETPQGWLWADVAQDLVAIATVARLTTKGPQGEALARMRFAFTAYLQDINNQWPHRPTLEGFVGRYKGQTKLAGRFTGAAPSRGRKGSVSAFDLRRSGRVAGGAR